jgi:hypothetical protein
MADVVRAALNRYKAREAKLTDELSVVRAVIKALEEVLSETEHPRAAPIQSTHAEGAQAKAVEGLRAIRTGTAGEVLDYLGIERTRALVNQYRTALHRACIKGQATVAKGTGVFTITDTTAAAEKEN